MVKECQELYDMLTDYQYIFTVGRKGISKKIVIGFDIYDFYHAVGLQYLSDVRQLKQSRDLVYQQIKSGEIPIHIIESSVSYSYIKAGRMYAFMNIVQLLESENAVFIYNSFCGKYNKISKLKYDAMLKTTEKGTNRTVYIFLQETGDTKNLYRIVSIFYHTDMDYTQGNTQWTILKKDKRKISTNTEETLYILPSYKSDN